MGKLHHIIFLKKLYVVYTKHKISGHGRGIVVRGKRRANKILKIFKKKYSPLGYKVYKRQWK